jgi:hypothetical protein
VVSDFGFPEGVAYVRALARRFDYRHACHATLLRAAYISSFACIRSDPPRARLGPACRLEPLLP